MAKDLPYFKFFCSEWNDGDITLEDFNIQGLFINICSYYWSKECDVTKKLVLKRFRNNKEDIEYLVKEGFIKFNNEHLSISFLNEQFSEVEAMSKSKSLAGKKSAKLKKLRKQVQELCKEFSLEFNVDLTKLQHEFNTDSTDVDFLLQHISTIKIRRDNRRKDKMTEDNTNNKKDEGLYYQNESEFLKDWNNARVKILRVKESNITKLASHELTDFNLIKNSFAIEDFKNGMRGLLAQKDMFPSNTLRPKHFLSDMNIEKYIDAYKNNKQLYENKNKYDVKL